MNFVFCFTIDTEPDNLWELNHLEFEQVRYLKAFHQRISNAGARPTYLTTSEMAEHNETRRILTKIFEQGNSELGVHFHTWTRTWSFPIPDLGTPPIHANAHQFGQEIEEQMLRYTCDALYKAFGTRPISYRGGRWSLNGNSLKSLRNCGIEIDTTTTPGLTWESPKQPLASGIDYRTYSRFPYYLAGESLTPVREGNILELPVATAFVPFKNIATKTSLLLKGIRKCFRTLGIPWGVLQLRPTTQSRKEMQYCMKKLLADRIPVWVAVIHSSEIISCVYFKTDEKIKSFWNRCEELIYDAIELGATPMTLAEAGNFIKNFKICNL
jgi:hypothetical protein